MMSAFEVKNFKDLMVLIAIVLCLLGALVGFPASMAWITWNALVGDLLHGPYISFLQSIPLALLGYVILILMFQPEIKFEVHKTKTPEDKENLVRRFGSNSPKGKSQE